MKISTMRPSLPLVALAATLLPLATNAITFEVFPDGSPHSIASALAEAGPGDTVYLADGIYDEPIITVSGGEEGRPLVIEGGRGAVIQGAYGDMHRAVYVTHSWVTIQGFTVDGLVGPEGEDTSYIDKCVWVEGEGEPTRQQYQGNEVQSSLIGFKMNGMNIKNCGGECVRLRNFVTNAELSNNVIEYCGVHDYRFDHGGENGEAIYVGTSSNQWTGGPDGTNYNVISSNAMRPFGNECVDVKEGATGNIIQDNDCAEQMDPDSGCYGSRGSGNVFRKNIGTDCVGAGIRLGGWEVDGVAYGQNNEVYDNQFKTTGNGAIAARVAPQGTICGNACEGSSCEVFGEDDNDVQTILATWDKACPSTLPEGSFGEDSSTSASSSRDSTRTTTSETPAEDDDASASSTDKESTSSTEQWDSDDGDDGAITTEEEDDDDSDEDSITSSSEDDSYEMTEEESQAEDDDGGDEDSSTMSSTAGDSYETPEEENQAEDDDDSGDGGNDDYDRSGRGRGGRGRGN